VKRAPDIGDLVVWALTTGIIIGKRGTDVVVVLRDGRSIWIPRNMVKVLSESR
jgi:hypothetical protein